MPSYELTRCIVCDGADTIEVASAADIRDEAELLWQFHSRRLSPRTPADRLVDRVAFSQDPPWRVVRCRSCGMIYRNPVEKRQALRGTYERARLTRDALLALHEAQRPSYRKQARRLRRHLARRGAGLEVGSYVGAFLAAAREEGWRFEGLDVNAQANAFVRTLGFVAHDGDLNEFAIGYPGSVAGSDEQRTDDGQRQFDCVAIWNTFDQLDDPRAALIVARRLLRPGGLIAIRVPNGACYADWRQRLRRRGPVRAFATALLAQNNLLTFPYRFGFSPPSLTRLLQENGFRVERVVRDVLVPTSDEWTRRWAVVEERAVRPMMQVFAPWFEAYATTKPVP